MPHQTDDTTLPYPVLKCIRKFQPALRAEIIAVVKDKMASLDRPITAEELGECASRVIFGDDGLYDRRMERVCLQAVDEGKHQRLQAVIDVLESKVAGSNSV